MGSTGGKSWIFRYKIARRERVMGLGPFPNVLLADARAKAAECRRQRVENVDPLEVKIQERQQRQIAERGQTSFRDCAEAYASLTFRLLIPYQGNPHPTGQSLPVFCEAAECP